MTGPLLSRSRRPAFTGALLDWVAVMSTISSIRLAHVILVFRAAHSLAAGKSSRGRFGPDRSQPGGVERGMRPLLNAGHDPAEYVAIARAVDVDPTSCWRRLRTKSADAVAG